MKHYAGLDVSVEETSVCILDETGKICREVKVTSHPEDLLRILQDPIWHFERIGLEAAVLHGSTGQPVGAVGRGGVGEWLSSNLGCSPCPSS
jgi:predicted NBD/HSP70 family sugar kinase